MQHKEEAKYPIEYMWGTPYLWAANKDPIMAKPEAPYNWLYSQVPFFLNMSSILLVIKKPPEILIDETKTAMAANN